MSIEERLKLICTAQAVQLTVLTYVVGCLFATSLMPQEGERLIKEMSETISGLLKDIK